MSTCLRFRIEQTLSSPTATSNGTAEEAERGSEDGSNAYRVATGNIKTSSNSKKGNNAKRRTGHSKRQGTRSSSRRSIPPLADSYADTAPSALATTNAAATYPTTTVRIAWDVKQQSRLANWEAGVGKTLLDGLPAIPALLQSSANRSISWETTTPSTAYTSPSMSGKTGQRRTLPQPIPEYAWPKPETYVDLDEDEDLETEAEPRYRHSVSITDTPAEKDASSQRGEDARSWLIELRSESLDPIISSEANTPLPTGTGHGVVDGFF
jgi:hypothetical protein